MSERRLQIITPRLVLGLSLMLFGTLFLLDELRIVDFDDLWRWWPLIPLAVGLTLIARPGTASRVFGVLLAIFGVWQLLYDFDFIDVEFWDAWPVLLIAGGAWVVWRSIYGGDVAFQPAPAPPPSGAAAYPPSGAAAASSPGAAPQPGGTASAPAGETSAADTLSSFAFLGYSQKGSTSQSFQGADVTAIMGGCKIDLRDAGTDPEGAVIDAFAFWGGIKILVGEDWVVTNKVLPLLGGVDDHSRAAVGATKQLLVRGSVIMGGVEIVNHDEDED